MKLHFPWPEVAKALNEVRAATVVKTLYAQITRKGLYGWSAIRASTSCPTRRVRRAPSPMQGNAIRRNRMTGGM
jgi:hypothetical protein